MEHRTEDDNVMDFECFIFIEKLSRRCVAVEFMGDLDSGMKSIHKVVRTRSSVCLRHETGSMHGKHLEKYSGLVHKMEARSGIGSWVKCKRAHTYKFTLFNQASNGTVCDLSSVLYTPSPLSTHTSFSPWRAATQAGLYSSKLGTQRCQIHFFYSNSTIKQRPSDLTRNFDKTVEYLRCPLSSNYFYLRN